MSAQRQRRSEGPPTHWASPNFQPNLSARTRHPSLITCHCLYPLRAHFTSFARPFSNGKIFFGKTKPNSSMFTARSLKNEPKPNPNSSRFEPKPNPKIMIYLIPYLASLRLCVRPPRPLWRQFADYFWWSSPGRVPGCTPVFQNTKKYLASWRWPRHTDNGFQYGFRHL